jgi:hypothetical protein
MGRSTFRSLAIVSALEFTSQSMGKKLIAAFETDVKVGGALEFVGRGVKVEGAFVFVGRGPVAVPNAE